jgi:hypothetical protein
MRFHVASTVRSAAFLPFYMDVICPVLAITLVIIASRRSGKISHWISGRPRNRKTSWHFD